MSKNSKLLAWVTLPALPIVVYGRGVTPYLPLNLDPDVEAQVERVLILGDRPALRRPIAAAEVLEALPKACQVDEPLCLRVERYLRRYMQNSGLEFASVEASVSSGKGASTVIPNAHGQTFDSNYQVAAAGYLQLSDFGLLNVGGVAYEGRAVPTGTYLSLGFDFAQLDIGYRDHWWSPTSNGSLLISTEAPTMPSVTLSNYRPLTPLGIEYELFLAQMSTSSQIFTAPFPGCTVQYAGANNTDPFCTTTGHPKMAGLHFGIEPVSGLALGANRVLVFGGGAAGGQSIKDVAKAFFDPATAQSTGFGNSGAVVGKQEASVVSQLTFPGRHPFSAYAEYGANDTSQGNAFLFGKPALAFGVHLPRIGMFDITLESEVWEPTWYVHGLGVNAGNGQVIQTGYGDGITNDHLSIGNWFGDQRAPGAVGGESQLMKVGYEPHFGGRFDLTLRMLRNESFDVLYAPFPYKREVMGSLSYARPWRGYAVGGQIDAGRDVFGANYTRLSAFLRLGEALPHAGESAALPEEDPSDSPRDHTEVYAEAGVNANSVYSDIDRRDGVPPVTSSVQLGPHLGVGARRQVSEHQDLGVGLDADDINGHLFLGVRALDYRYRFNSPVALEAFVGAARYQLGSPAIGWYMGGGPQWRNIMPGWDLSATARFGWSLARQRDQPNDVNPGGFAGQQPDSFQNVYSFSLSLSHKF